LASTTCWPPHRPPADRPPIGSALCPRRAESETSSMTSPSTTKRSWSRLPDPPGSSSWSVVSVSRHRGACCPSAMAPVRRGSLGCCDARRARDQRLAGQPSERSDQGVDEQGGVRQHRGEPVEPADRSVRARGGRGPFTSLDRWAAQFKTADQSKLSGEGSLVRSLCSTAAREAGQRRPLSRSTVRTEPSASCMMQSPSGW